MTCHRCNREFVPHFAGSQLCPVCCDIVSEKGLPVSISFAALVEKNTERARIKHTEFPHDNPAEILALLMEELGEAAKAYNDGDKSVFMRELVDMVTVVQRAWEGR